VAIHSLDLNQRVAEVGYWMRSSAVGNGYASEGLAAVSQWAFSNLGVSRLWCYPEAANEASVRLAKRLGFMEVGRTLNNGAERIDMRAELSASGLRPAQRQQDPRSVSGG